MGVRIAGTAAALLKLAVSWTTLPMVAFRVVTLVPAVASRLVVARVGEFLPTTRTSLQGVVVPLLFVSGVQTCGQSKVPAFRKVTALESGIDPPVVKVLMVGVWLL